MEACDFGAAITVLGLWQTMESQRPMYLLCMRRYNLFLPPYDHTYGGNRALHQLKRELRKRGCSVRANRVNDPEAIAIYPEIVRDNPFNSKRRVRWLLNEAVFTDEICYAWEREMGDFPLLTVNIVEMSLWKRARKKTKNVAFYVGKGTLNSRVIPDGAIEITRTNFPKRRKLAKLIASLDHLISFDPFSAINIEATVAGTPVLLQFPDKQWLPTGTQVGQPWSRERLERQGWLKYGIAYRQDELALARETVGLQRDYFAGFVKEFDERINSFIAETQETFA